MTKLTEPAGDVRERIEGYRHGRVPRRLRERQLLELAATLFAERGYAGASMDELARRAGISKPVIYNLFGSKQGLFAACTNELGRELTEIVVAAVAEAEGPEELLRAGSLAFFRFVRARSGLWAVAYGSGGLPDSDPEVAGELSAIRSRQNQLVETVIVAATSEQGVELEPRRAEAFARGLNGMYEGLAGWAIEHPEVPDETLAEWVVEGIIPGLVALVDRRRS